MMIIKLLAVVGIAASIGTDTTRFQNIKYAAPVSYDYKIAWEYKAGLGYYQLFGTTTSGGGITEQILFTDAGTYWASTTSSFFGSEFNFQIRVFKSTLNNELFTAHPSISGHYYYTSPDNANISYYAISGRSALSIRNQVIDSDYSLNIKIDKNASSTAQYDWIYSGDAWSRHIILSTDTHYNYFATFSRQTLCEIGSLDTTAGALNTHITAFYFKMIATANIEGDDWWNIYNEGVDWGYRSGYGDGERAGIDIGRLENTAWEDAFTIIKGAIDTVGDVMAIQLFGPVSIGTLVSIPLIVGLLFWIIDKWRGS